MPKVDAVAELAGKLVRTLQEMRAEPSGYPPTLGTLSARADPAATAEQVKKALAKKPFASQLLPSSKKLLEGPIALAEDLDLLARSPALLEFALGQLCTAEKPLALLPKVVAVVEKAIASGIPGRPGTAGPRQPLARRCGSLRPSRESRTCS